MAMWQQRRGPGDDGGMLEALRDPQMSSVIAYLARERSAAMPKIAFDLKMTITDAAKTVHDLRERGLVREAGEGRENIAQQKVPTPGMSAFYILTEQGLEASRLLRSKGAWDA